MGAAGVSAPEAVLELIASISGGDARIALQTLEIAVGLARGARRKESEGGGRPRGGPAPRASLRSRRGKSTTTSFRRSISASEGATRTPALYWLARMLEAGEDPLYVARRLVRFASEDVGLADPDALAARDGGAGRGPLPGNARMQHGAGPARGVSGARAQEQLDLHGLRPRVAGREGEAALPRSPLDPKRAHEADEGPGLRR